MSNLHEAAKRGRSAVAPRGRGRPPLMVNRTKLLDALLSVDNTYPGGWASAKMIQRMAGFSRSCFWNACRNERDIIEIGPHPDGANLKLYRIKPRARKAARARCH